MDVEAPPFQSVSLGNLRVLVVDDNATNRRIQQEVLTNWKMRPTVVDGGSAALVALEQAWNTGEPYALVLLDQMMPDMDGFIVAKRIRQHPALLGYTVMMLSSADHRGDAIRCRELGVSAYLTKPVRQSVLWDAIVSALGMSHTPESRLPQPTAHELGPSHATHGDSARGRQRRESEVGRAAAGEAWTCSHRGGERSRGS